MSLVADKYLALKAGVNDRFDRLKANEEELNRIFAKIYHMEGEVPIEVEDKYVSVARIFDTEDEIPESFKGNKYVRTKRDEIISLISYAVGCMFGRWSLDKDGLILADAGSTVEDYLAKLAEDGVAEPTWMPDATNVLPITDDVYFEDDLASQLFRWVETVYGKDSLEENLAFIANALKPDARATPRDVIREYLIKEFYRTTSPPTRSGPSTGSWTPARRTASRPSSTCTVTARTFWPACAPSTCTHSSSASARGWMRLTPSSPPPRPRRRPASTRSARRWRPRPQSSPSGRRPCTTRRTRWWSLTWTTA